MGGDQREIKGYIKSLVCMKQHTHEHTSTVKNRNQLENYDSGIMKQTYCSYRTKVDSDL